MSESILSILLAGALVLVLLAWGAREMRRRAARKALAADIERFAEAGPDIEIDLSRHIAYRGVSDAVQTLVGHWSRSRRDRIQAIAAATARADATVARLEAVLRDLSEGVIFCDAGHTVQLYNRAALWHVETPERLGLGRSLFDLVTPAAVEKALADLNERRGSDPDALSTVPVVLTGHGGSHLDARMSLVGSATDKFDSYVLALIGRDQATETPLPPRPEFYDFDIRAGHGAPEELRERALDDLSFVVFDTETTGLRPSEGDEIVSIGAVRVVSGRILRGETFERLVNPGRPIPMASIRFHGITDDMVADAPGIIDVLPEFQGFVGDQILVAHNAAFDLKFLSMKQAATGVSFSNPVLDTLFLSACIYGESGDHSLDGLMARFGIMMENNARHSALGDAVVTAEVLLRLFALMKEMGVATLGDALDKSDMALNLRRMDKVF